MRTRRRRTPFAGLATQLRLLGALGMLAAATLATSDAGAGDPGGAGSGEAGGGGDGAPPPATGTDDTKGGKPDEFTPLTAAQQAHVDNLIAKATGKAKSTTEAEIRRYLEQQGMDEVDRLKAEKTAAEQLVEEARGEALDARIETTAERLALAAGCKPDRVGKLLKLISLDRDACSTDGKPDTDAIRAIVEQELTDTPELKGTATPPGASGGDHAGTGDTKVWTREDIAKLSPAEFAKHEAEIDKAAQLGLIKA